MSALAPKADKAAERLGCPLSAKSGHMQCSKNVLLSITSSPEATCLCYLPPMIGSAAVVRERVGF
jgi:hypothetical protein